MKSIIVMEKVQKKIKIRTQAGTYDVRDTLTAMYERLPSYFLRISQSVIVNVHEILCIEGNEVFMSTHDSFIVGRIY